MCYWGFTDADLPTAVGLVATNSQVEKDLDQESEEREKCLRIFFPDTLMCLVDCHKSVSWCMLLAELQDARVQGQQEGAPCCWRR
jgi:hypothetical protein